MPELGRKYRLEYWLKVLSNLAKFTQGEGNVFYSCGRLSLRIMFFKWEKWFGEKKGVYKSFCVLLDEDITKFKTACPLCVFVRRSVSHFPFNYVLITPRRIIEISMTSRQNLNLTPNSCVSGSVLYKDMSRSSETTLGVLRLNLQYNRFLEQSWSHPFGRILICYIQNDIAIFF